MDRTAIAHYLYLVDQAFEPDGHPEHALLLNLRSVRDDAWFWLPEGARRCIFDVVAHVGECKYVYDNHAFGDGSMRWDRPGSVPSIARTATRAEIIDWLREGSDGSGQASRRWRQMRSCSASGRRPGASSTRRGG